jgi:uncharacterized protein
MRIVVSGSSGFIGTALVPVLRQDGHDVVRLVRRKPAAADERAWDPPAGRLDAGALDGADAVVNLCGAGVGDKRWSGAYKQQIRDSRIEPTDVLARAVAERGVPVLVNGSATGYYGDTGNAAVDESSPAGSGFLAEVCRDWETATQPATDAGARAVLLRTGMVLAPSGGVLGKLLPLFRRGLGGRLGNGRQYLPWVSMDDVLAAIRFLIRNDGVHGPVNVTGPVPVTNGAFTRELAAVLHRPAPWTVPALALRLALGEITEDLLGSQRVIPKVLQEQGFRFVHPTLRSALHACLQDDGVGVKSGR